MRELEGMEEAIRDAEDEVTQLETKIHAPGFYRQDHEKVGETLAALEASRSEVEGLYERWEELDGRA